MSSDESDIQLPPVVAKKLPKKVQLSPTANILRQEDHRKVPTKVMVNQALIDLKTRKGVSIYAIKKYIEERYEDKPDKIHFYIKKYIKSAVEKGEIVQVKGIGASGSFRLVPTKEKVEKKKKPLKPKEKQSKTKKKEEKSNEAPAKKATKKNESKDTIDKAAKTVKIVKDKEKAKKKKSSKEVEKTGNEPQIVKKKTLIKAKKLGMGAQSTPLKKRSMMKRKSIGSVIKKPKMKPGKA